MNIMKGVTSNNPMIQSSNAYPTQSQSQAGSNDKAKKSKDEFSELALKIRMEKIDKEEIKKLRKETITNERYKTKLKRSVFEIQRIYRGYLSRRKFRHIVEELNIETIIDYLNHKRIKRIHSQSKEIISYYVNEYLNIKRQQKQKIIIGYLNYCADVIISTYESYKIRKKIAPLLQLIHGHKDKISTVINSFKVRLILRSSGIQNILVELANIKFCLNHNNNMKKDEKNDLMADFAIRLPKLQHMFYTEYYKLRRKKNWTSMAKTETPWLLQYFSLIFKDNPKYAMVMNSKRSKGEFNINNKTISKKSFAKEEKEQTNKKYDDYDNKPIRPLNKGKNKGHDGMIEEENDSEFNQNIQQNIEEDYGNRSSSLNKKRKKMNPYDDYDNKPIKAKRIDYDNLEANESTVPLNDGEQIEESNANRRPKRKVNKHKEKAPKYDARKAIEEQKEREAVEGKKEVKSSFRDFIREMKNTSKGGHGSLPSNTISTGGGGGGGGIGGGNGDTITTNPNDDKEKAKMEERKRNRKEPTEITMRKKLHELERSPPPMMNLQNVKSRISCWGTESNDSNIQNIRRIRKEDTVDEPFSINKIETTIARLNTGFNLQSYFKEKEEKMKTLKRIPYIKHDYSIVKKYNKELYDILLKEINSQYDAIKT